MLWDKAMRNPVRDWIEAEWGAQVLAWAIPVDESTVFYEVIVEGQMIRAESVAGLVAALNEARIARFDRQVRQPLRLVA
jgi:hypothetical protein